MRKLLLPLVVLSLAAGSTVCHAETAPFGVASAFNLVALGTTGSSPIAGNIATSADVEGRIAAANDVTLATGVGATLQGDPWGSLANDYAIVAGVGVTVKGSINVGGGGNVYAPTNAATYNWNETPRGTVISSGTSPINFATLRTTLDALTVQLAGLTNNGVVGAPTPSGGNPSWLVLKGTSTTLDVFTLTAAQFASSNNPIDIVTPAGATVIINVEGVNPTLGTGIYFNGAQEGDSNNDNGDILFNFEGATTVTIDGQLDGAVLAPNAIFTSDSQVGGNILVAQVGLTGEIHNVEFNGTLPTSTVTPEPGTWALVGSGMLAMIFFGRRERRV
jgi:choice-of-anchor A domain-containing protein